MQKRIVTVLNEMSEYLSLTQMKKLQEVMLRELGGNRPDIENLSNEDYLTKFLEAKRVEGCSGRTIKYYQATVEHLLKDMAKFSIRKMTTEDIRTYLMEYQKINGCSNVTIDNVRRNLSSFFNWLEEEDYILKSPMRRIHKIRTKKSVKTTISDESMEKLRDGCDNLRDLAMIDLLYATGIRVGELVNLNIDDVDFEKQSVLLHGKGGKDRISYFTDKAALFLRKYLATRTDSNPALFVSRKNPDNRVTKNSIEQMIRVLGKQAGVDGSHPHRFRVTRITVLVNRGMPLQDVQELAGHSDINTTRMYYRSNKERVRYEYLKVA